MKMNTILIGLIFLAYVVSIVLFAICDIFLDDFKNSVIWGIYAILLCVLLFGSLIISILCNK